MYNAKFQYFFYGENEGEIGGKGGSSGGGYGGIYGDWADYKDGTDSDLNNGRNFKLIGFGFV